MHDKTRPAPEWAKKARILSAVYEDLPNLERVAGEFKASVLLLYCCPEMTNAWCPSGSWEEVKKFIVAAHEYGLKVVCYYDNTIAEEAFYLNGHQDWTQRNEFGEPQHYQPAHAKAHRYCFCFNSPWSKRVARIAAGYIAVGADGVFLDNPDYYTFTGETCFCRHCRQLFHQEMQEDISLADDERRTAFLQRSMARHLERVYAAMLRESEDRLPVMCCNTAGNSPVRCLENLGHYENVLFLEAFPSSQEEDRVALDRGRKLFPDKPLWVILTETPGSGLWSSNAEAAARDFDDTLQTVLAAGGCPMVWSSIPSQDPDHPGFTNISIYNKPVLAEVIRKYF